MSVNWKDKNEILKDSIFYNILFFYGNKKKRLGTHAVTVRKMACINHKHRVKTIISVFKSYCLTTNKSLGL